MNKQSNFALKQTASLRLCVKKTANLKNCDSATLREETSRKAAKPLRNAQSNCDLK
jgi:hypothetical protein